MSIVKSGLRATPLSGVLSSNFNWSIPFLLGLVLRLAYVLLYPQQAVRADASCYDALGWSLARGLGYSLPAAAPDVYWSPGYPGVLAAIYSLFGHSQSIVRVAQALLSSVVPVLVGAMAARLFGRRIAFIAAMLCAVYPAFVGYTGLLLTETLFGGMLVLTVYLLLGISRQVSMVRLVGAGVVVGLTCLVRAETVLLPLCVFVGLWWFFRDQSAGPRQWAIVYAVVFLTIAPWTARNYAVTGEFIPLTIHDGDVLWISSYPEELLELDTEREPYRSLVAGLSQFDASRALRREGVRNIVEHPATYLWLSVKRLPRLWLGGHSNLFVGMLDSIGAYWHRGEKGVAIIKVAMLGANSVLVLLGIWGAYLSVVTRKGDAKSLIVVGAPVAFITALHFVLFATPRFHVPVMPFVLTFAAVAIAALLPGGDGVTRIDDGVGNSGR